VSERASANNRLFAAGEPHLTVIFSNCTDEVKALAEIHFRRIGARLMNCVVDLAEAVSERLEPGRSA